MRATTKRISIMTYAQSSTDELHLLLVEDDEELASLVQEYLSKNGYCVSIIGDGLEAGAYIRAHHPDLVLLDIMLPGQSGMDVCRQVRPDYTGPILMLTALDEDLDQMLGLELGADDYVIKPIKPRLLLSRIRALLRRTVKKEVVETAIVSSVEPPATTSLRVDIKARAVSMADRAINLTTAEYDLLSLLIDEAGTVVSRDTIVRSLRGFDYDGLDRSIDRRISRLRKKLHDDPTDPKIIKTIRGKGYLLCASVEYSC